MASLNKLPTGQLGRNGPQIPRLGIGLVGASGMYGIPASDVERLAFLDEVYKKDETFWGTGKFPARLGSPPASPETRHGARQCRHSGA